MYLKKRYTLFLVLSVSLSLMGCYQAHSDDGLRTIPTTNNPNIVPKGQGVGLPSI